MTDDIRLGILGPGRIFRRVMADLPLAGGIKITAVASRDAQRAAAAAEICGGVRAYTSYEEMASSDDVDLVYIATPHVFHKEQAIMCMEHGKHVLCEKPIALNPDEVRAMRDCARKNGVFLMEAMWTRFFPAAYYLREKIASGALGRVKLIRSNFCYDSSAAPDMSRIWNMDLAGGALLDVGVYDLAAAADFLGTKPQTVQGLCRKWRTGCDASFSVQMMYADGACAQFTCACDVTTESTMELFCEKGRVTVPDFWHPTRLEINYYGNGRELREFPAENEGFRHEFEHVAECIREGLTVSPVMPIDDSVDISGIMTALRYENGIFYPQEGKNNAKA